MSLAQRTEGFGVKGFAFDQHRPQRSSHLVGQRGHDHVIGSSGQQSGEPGRYRSRAYALGAAERRYHDV